MIVDEAEQKGTGRWTAQDALELGVPLTADHRGGVRPHAVGPARPTRARRSRRLAGPRAGGRPPLRRARSSTTSSAALYASKVVAYAQGFEQMAAASRGRRAGTLDLGAIATIWRGGCIIRARFLDRIREAYEADPATAEPAVRRPTSRTPSRTPRTRGGAWSSVAVERGVPVPAFSSALAWYDGYRRERGPANLVQGLRDYFGAHTYRRVDREGTFHTRWGQDGQEVRT